PGFPRGRKKSSARTRVQWFRSSGRRTGNPGWEPPIADSRVVACGAWRVVGQRSIPRKRLSDDNTDTPHGPSGRRPRRSTRTHRTGQVAGDLEGRASRNGGAGARIHDFKETNKGGGSQAGDGTTRPTTCFPARCG